MEMTYEQLLHKSTCFYKGRKHIYNKVDKNGPSKICGIQPLKI